MKILDSIKEIKTALAADIGKKIALVPTMGSLHAGHLALIEQARKLADKVVVSIFVNPTQFNDDNDFKHYPRDLEADIKKLESAQVDYLFAPEAAEIYPPHFGFKIVPLRLVDCLCGSFRPGHFEGVSLIIAKLFNIINPDFAIFGEKDFQQLVVIRNLARDLNFSVEIVGVETLRESSGLALSSRNQRLSPEGLAKATVIYQTLNEIKKEVLAGTKIDLLQIKKQQQLKDAGFSKIDYLEIRGEENLNLINDYKKDQSARIFVAAYLEKVRLIDNLKI